MNDRYTDISCEISEYISQSEIEMYKKRLKRKNKELLLYNN